MSGLAEPAVADAAQLIVAGLTLQLLEDRHPADVILGTAEDEDRVPCPREVATYLAAVHLCGLVVAQASHVLAVDVPELTSRLGALVARQTVRS